MKRFKVETSLFEPIEVEIAGKVFVTQPLSAKLIREVNDLLSQIRDKKVDEVEGTVKVAALIFGADPVEFDAMDIRALTVAVDYAQAEMAASRGTKKGAPEVVPLQADPAVPGESKN
jgi:hypothetical protein